MRFLRGRFSEFDQFAEAIGGWNLDWRQLDAGRLRAEMTQVETTTGSIARFSLNRRFFQSGSIPRGTRTFGLHDGGTPPSVIRGQTIHANSLLAFPNDYTATSERGFRALGFSFSEALLAETAEREGVRDLFDRIDTRQLVIACTPGAIAALRGRVVPALRRLERQSGVAAAASLRHEIEVEVPTLLVRALVSGAAADDIYPRLAGNRELVARRARAFIDQRADEPPSMEEVGHHTRVSLRTLRYAFSECYGVSPKRYLQSLRLNRVRGELRTADPETLVSDVANRWGFWHMGQFAADYRSLFGELPSDTPRQNDERQDTQFGLGPLAPMSPPGTVS